MSDPELTAREAAEAGAAEAEALINKAATDRAARAAEGAMAKFKRAKAAVEAIRKPAVTEAPVTDSPAATEDVAPAPKSDKPTLRSLIETEVAVAGHSAEAQAWNIHGKAAELHQALTRLTGHDIGDRLRYYVEGLLKVL